MAKDIGAGDKGAQAKPPRRSFGVKEQRRFLEQLAATCNASEAARQTGWPPSTVHQRRQRDPAFAMAWKDAIAAAYERLEEALIAHALKETQPIPFDPDAVEIVITEPPARGGPGGRAGRLATVNTQLGLSLLGRREAAMRKGRERRSTRKATPDEVMTAINHKLDKLAGKLMTAIERGDADAEEAGGAA